MRVGTLAPGAEESDVVTMELEPEKRREPLAPGVVRTVFLTLAAIALVALLAAIAIILLAPDATPLLLITAIVVLVLVILAEVVLLLVARPGKA
jgi:hypothetical protein